MKRIITDSMTFDDLREIIGQESAVVGHAIEKGVKSYGRMARQGMNTKRIYFPPIKLKSSSGLNTVIQFFSRAQSEQHRDKLGVYQYYWYNHKGGIHGVSVSTLERQMAHFSIYTPHFIERYRERFLGDMSKSKPDVLDHFMRQNLKRMTVGVPSEKYDHNLYSIVNDGICLCEFDENIIITYRTFITYDMAGKSQQELALEANKEALTRGLDLAIPEDEFINWN